MSVHFGYMLRLSLCGSEQPMRDGSLDQLAVAGEFPWMHHVVGTEDSAGEHSGSYTQEDIGLALLDVCMIVLSWCGLGWKRARDHW